MTKTKKYDAIEKKKVKKTSAKKKGVKSSKPLTSQEVDELATTIIKKRKRKAGVRKKTKEEIKATEIRQLAEGIHCQSCGSGIERCYNCGERIEEEVEKETKATEIKEFGAITDNGNTHKDRKAENGDLWRDHYYNGYYTGTEKMTGSGKLVRNVRVSITNGNEPAIASFDLFAFVKQMQGVFPSATRATIMKAATEQFKRDIADVIDQMTKV